MQTYHFAPLAVDQRSPNALGQLIAWLILQLTRIAQSINSTTTTITDTPQAQTSVVHEVVTLNPPANVSAVVQAAAFEIYTDPNNAKTFATIEGAALYAEHDGSGNIAEIAGAFIGAAHNGAGVATDVVALELSASDIGAGSSTTATGLRVLAVTGAGTNKAIETAAGIVDLGDQLRLPASTTSRAPLRIASGTAPSSPVDGDIWYDGTNIKIRVGGTTKTFTIV